MAAFVNESFMCRRAVVLGWHGERLKRARGPADRLLSDRSGTESQNLLPNPTAIGTSALDTGNVECRPDRQAWGTIEFLSRRC